MYGAILGDMIGAPYEFDRGSKTKDFPMFTDPKLKEIYFPIDDFAIQGVAVKVIKDIK